MLQVDTEFDINNITISIIPLAAFKPSANVSCIVSGWGVTEQVRYFVLLKIIDDNFAIPKHCLGF